LSDWKILTSRSLVRMEDAQLIAEIALAMRSGVVSSSNALLRQLYKDFDDAFPEGDEWGQRVDDTFAFVQGQLSPIQNSFMTKSYAFLSLVTALIHARWGIPHLEQQTGIAPLGTFTVDADQAVEGLLALASAHETKDTAGKFKDYVDACKGGSNRVRQRLTRVEFTSKALRGEL
jgi:hypothetical protein